MNLSRKPEFFLHLLILNAQNFLLGANTCLKLKQFEEAIIWCDKGLTVSFLYTFHRPSFSLLISSCARTKIKTARGFIKKQHTGQITQTKGNEKACVDRLSFRRRVNTNP